MIEVGQKVRFIPLKDVRVFGLEDDNKEKIGVITYINVPHKWFLVEYDGIGCKLRSGYKFCDIGATVFIGETSSGDQTLDRATSRTYVKGYEKTMSLADYIATKITIMRELGVKPTDNEIDRLLSLNSEIKVDTAVREILKKRWAQRKYK